MKEIYKKPTVFSNRLQQLRISKDLTQEELSEELQKQFGMKTDRATIAKWENGHQSPLMNAVSCLSKFFGVSMDYLNGDDEDILPNSDIQIGLIIKENRQRLNLSQEELGMKVGVNKAAVQKWESGAVQNIKRKTLVELCEIFGITPPQLMGWDKERSSNKTSLPYYSFPTCAGNGNYMISEGYDFEYKEFENVPDNATFAVRIQGDSMEPQFSDGDIAFVKAHVIVESGQIGIFIVNNESYLKKLSGNFLVSLNPDPKYPPKEIGEFDEFHCVGRVVGKAENK